MTENTESPDYYMNATCNPDIAHDHTVIHQFCDSCDFETYSSSELNSVYRADLHKQVMLPERHQLFICEDGRQY